MSAGLADDDRLTIEQQVCFTLAVASRDVIALYRPFLEPLGLTHPQYLVMVALWGQAGPICVKDLSTLLKLEPPSLSPLLKRLEAAGLIDRRRDPTDERSLLITLTPPGQDLRHRAATVPNALLERLGMSLDELEKLQTALIRVIDHANTPITTHPTAQQAPVGCPSSSPG